MAIAPDAHTVQTNTGNSPWSFSFTASGNERLIVVGTVGDRANTGITYNGVGLTNPNTQTLTFAATSLQFWYLIAPATGSNTLQITPGAGAPANWLAFVSSWTGVDQVSPLGTVAAAILDTQVQEFITANPSCLKGEVAVSIMASINRNVQVASPSVLTPLDANNAFGDYCGAHGYKVVGAPSSPECRFTWTAQSNQIAAEITYPLRPANYPPPTGLKPNVLRPRPFKPGLAR